MTLASSIEALLAASKLEQNGERDERVLKTEWNGIVSTCLWGNATVCPFPLEPDGHNTHELRSDEQDLSLLTSLTHEEIQALQSVERGSNFILKHDDTWDHVNKLRSKRIDIVLDNVRIPIPRLNL